ncbi:MAG: type II toxin-antitoxin system RelE/ParE family toxin [Planctomycetota bacterium]
MTRAIRFTLAAEQDVTTAFLWYEGQSSGLGTRLMARMNDLLARVAEAPKQFPEVMSGYRRALLQRFPYGLYFSLGHDEVVVHAILHLQRDPARWRDRLAGGAG